MKESELRQFAKCALCHRLIGQTKIPFLFYRITVERFILDAGACKRQQGLGMMLGHGGLAMVMGPDEDLATALGGPVTFGACEECSQDSNIVFAALSRIELKSEDEDIDQEEGREESIPSP